MVEQEAPALLDGFAAMGTYWKNREAFAGRGGGGLHQADDGGVAADVEARVLPVDLRFHPRLIAPVAAAPGLGGEPGALQPLLGDLTERIARRIEARRVERRREP